MLNEGGLKCGGAKKSIWSNSNMYWIWDIIGAITATNRMGNLHRNWISNRGYLLFKEGLLVEVNPL